MGQSPGGENERWFVDRLVDAGHRVHAIELPTEVADFEREYLRPVQRYHDTHAPAAVVSHSLGGLVAAHLVTDASRVYLAPWWGLYGLKYLGWQSRVVPRLPTRVRILPVRASRSEIGGRVTDEGWAALPRRISPVTVTEIHRAQEALPSIDDEAVVFCSLRDTIVSLRTIGEVASRDQVRLYDGGHELFSSTDRRAATREVLAALEET
jgi:alpha-beta hydrolase superfamily lysophospholipase